MCQVPKIQFADLLELIVRTGALDVDYLRPKKQPPADGLGRGRVTEYEVLQDAIKSELLSIDDKGAGAQNASLDFGEFLEFVCRHVWRLHVLEGATHDAGLAHYHSRLDHWIEGLCDILYFEDSHAELRARYVPDEDILGDEAVRCMSTPCRSVPTDPPVLGGMEYGPADPPGREDHRIHPLR